MFENSTRKKYPISLIECTQSSQFKLFRDTINQYHSYVKYKDSPTRRLSFLVYESESGNFIGSVGLTSGTLALKCREQYIGWNNQLKMQHMNEIANNSRFCLIQENITISNAASMTLKSLRTYGVERWKQKYGNQLILLETFILPSRIEEFKGNLNRNGACYKADNWIEIGMTEGNSITKIPIKMWQKEKTERGRLARENPEECMRQYSFYAKNNEKYGYGITQTDKKIVFIRPLVKNWLKIFLSGDNIDEE
jgi:Domain of unknown function (DUF4338)